MSKLLVVESNHTEWLFGPTNKHLTDHHKHYAVHLAEQCTGKTYSDVQLVNDVPNDGIFADDIIFLTETQLEHHLHQVQYMSKTTGNVMVCQFFEPHCDQYNIEIINKHLSDHKVWYISCNADVFSNTGKNITPVYFDFFSGFIWFGTAELLTARDYGIDEVRDFLSLNAKNRPSRMEMFRLLEQQDLLDKGYISKGPQFLEKTNTIDPVEFGNANVLIPCFEDISSWTSNVYYEIINDHVLTPGPGPDFKFIFISEKFYRCVYNKNPFLLHAKPGALSYIRALGYKTFDTLFDESYDTITNWRLRTRAIVQQVSWFSKLSEQQKQEWYDQARPIIEHNYNHMQTSLSKLYFEPLNNTRTP